MAKKDRKDDVAASPRDTEKDIVVLSDEEGVESRFRILYDSLYDEDRQYEVLMPLDQEDSAEPEIVILRVDETEDGENILSTIDSDDEWEEVLEAFEELDLEQNLGDYEIEVEDPEE